MMKAHASKGKNKGKKDQARAHKPAEEDDKKPEEDHTMKAVAPFIAKCQGELPSTDECSLAKGFDPAKQCNTHVEESQKCKSCKKKLLPCVKKAMMKAHASKGKNKGKKDQARAHKPAEEDDKKPEEDHTMKAVAPFIAKCQGELPSTDECSLAKGFDPAKQC